MRAKELYCQATLAGKEYLLPYGQNIADFQSGIQTNETGVLIWRLLQQDKSLDELTAAIAEKYQISPEGLPGLRKDIEEYTRTLSDCGILEDSVRPAASCREHFIQTGPLYISLSAPDSLFERYFAQFASPAPKSCHQSIRVHLRQPLLHDNGTVLVRNRDVIILDGEDRYIFLFPAFSSINELHVTRDGSEADLYCSSIGGDEAEEQIFHAIRFAFLILAQRHGLFLIHSASLCYRGEAWLFSGSSGTGKSTHTNLWAKHFGAELLNGDLNMIGEDGGRPVVYGQPWCGTSGICTQRTFPLGGIVLLKQSVKNMCQELEPHRKILDCAQRMISPAWTEELLLQNIHFSEWLEANTAIFHLWCTAEKEAAETMRERIDQWYA